MLFTEEFAPGTPNVMEPGDDLPGSIYMPNCRHRCDPLHCSWATIIFRQHCWKRSVQLLVRHYNAPKGQVGEAICLHACRQIPRLHGMLLLGTVSKCESLPQWCCKRVALYAEQGTSAAVYSSRWTRTLRM